MVVKLRFCLKGGVCLHPPRETEEEEELHKLWRHLCEELQGKHHQGSLEPFRNTHLLLRQDASTVHVGESRICVEQAEMTEVKCPVSAQHARTPGQHCPGG